MYTQINPNALRILRDYQTPQGPLEVRSAPLAPSSPMTSSSMIAPAVGAVALAAAGYFLVPKHAMVAALGGAVVGGLAGYLAYPPSAAAAPAGSGPSKF
jgi:hypothetical protein